MVGHVALGGVMISTEVLIQYGFEEQQQHRYTTTELEQGNVLDTHGRAEQPQNYKYSRGTAALNAQESSLCDHQPRDSSNDGERYTRAPYKERTT